jgi:hypothetical protein
MCDAALIDAASVCRVPASERHKDGSRFLFFGFDSVIGAAR